MADTESESVRFKGRKRLRYEHLWKKKRRKLQKDSGSAYETYKGESKPAKELDPISCSCGRDCSKKVTISEQTAIFSKFYELSNHDTQNKYLFGLIKKAEVKRRRAKGGSTRSAVFHYYVRLSNGEETEVCKGAFCQVHAVGKKRVENLAKKLGESLIPSDDRGKHKNRPHTIPESTKDKIREHIRSFPRRQSHYSRSDNLQRQYLPEGLSIAEMHRSFVQKHGSVKEWLYRKIFNEEFNLAFGYPRSDTCQRCDELKLAIANSQDEEERLTLTLAQAEHQCKAGQGYQSLREDTQLCKSDPSYHVITFDLQQNLPVPTLTHSAMFYLRQLWVYNFGIHDCGSGSAVMCVWNETIAGRGSSEIISCLLQYFAQLRTRSTKLICYSDSCFGQNKNFGVMCFWSSLIIRKQFEQIDHKFLVRGHTYLPNDRDFSHIEKRKPSARIYIPEHWEEVISSSRKSDPFQIQKMTPDLFQDFSTLEKQFTRRKKSTDGEDVLISKVTWMNFGQASVNYRGATIVKNHPDEVWLRYTYVSAEPWSKVSILKGRKKQQPNVDVCVPQLYPNGHGIKPKKCEDLQKMIPYIPTEHHSFYEELEQYAQINAPDSDDDN